VLYGTQFARLCIRFPRLICVVGQPDRQTDRSDHRTDTLSIALWDVHHVTNHVNELLAERETDHRVNEATVRAPEVIRLQVRRTGTCQNGYDNRSSSNVVAESVRRLIRRRLYPLRPAF
jgi:hypothetical protein